MTNAQEILENSFRFRGAIIHETSLLERLVDVYLANYFCESEEKVVEIIDIVLGGNRISFDGKRKILDVILKKKNSDIYQKYPSFKADMNTVLYGRNNFAHCTLVTNDEALAKSKTHIGLARFGVNTRVDWYDQKRIDSIRKAISDCREVMAELVF